MTETEVILPAEDRQETLTIDYCPTLTASHGEEFYEAAYAAAFQPLATQVRLLNESVSKARLEQRSAASRGSKEETDALAQNIAALLLLRDLLQIGWRLTLRGPNIQLSQPNLDDHIDRAKEQIRESMKFERQESIGLPAVREFVHSMERPRQVNNDQHSIFSLMADGKRLFPALQSASVLSGDARADALISNVKPYLQLVEGEKRDEFTNLRLIDIWRYFRLTWSTPYRPTPGRNLFYLIRDEGQPYHPIMGIAALANCVIGMKCRDDRIGWTPDAIAERVLTARASGKDEFSRMAWKIAGLLEAHLEEGIAAISLNGLISRNAVAFPTQEAVDELEKIAQDAAEDRYVRLRQEAISTSEVNFDLVAPDALPSTSVARELRESSTALFLRKRASKLASLLHAKLICQQKNVFDNPPLGLPALLWNERDWDEKPEPIKSDAGRSAMRAILNANKDTKIGSAMMEIIVCGAVAPYNALLGGKLVAMLLASPQVVRDYEERYGSQASTIASQVAGRDITRRAHLVYLGTSSLYVSASDRRKFGNAIGATPTRRPSSSSQYNRIHVPASVAGGEGEIQYQCIGMTEGFGVVHFSADTREALEELDMIAHRMKRVNSLFGEGTSPRMRKIRQGISLLGLDDRFLVHGQSRLVYGVNLAHNTEAYLMGEADEPNYILPNQKPQEITTRIASYWTRRWLCSRLDHTPALYTVASFDPHTAAVSREYGEADDQFLGDLGL